MKRVTNLFCAVAIAVAGIVPAVTAQPIPESWSEIKAPPLRNFEIQQPKRIELKNGMVIFLQEDREVPLVRGSITVPGGSRMEPAAKVGLSDVYGQVWRTGGTEKQTGDQLDDFLEARAAKVETSTDRDSSSISWDALKEDFDVVFGVVQELLKNPAFRDDKIDLAKKQLNTSIARRNDSVGGIASREAQRLVYGDDSPLGRLATYDSVAAVERQDLIDWHRKFVHPNNMIVGIVGDFDAKVMEQKLRKAFDSWPKGPEIGKFSFTVPAARPGVYFIPKDDVTQTQIRVVHVGTTRDNPDYHAIQMLNEIFGGGFSARLFSRIRSDKGLAYSVGGGVGTAYDHPGLFQISMSTKSGTTLEAIKALHGEIDSITSGAIDPGELSRARESILNSFIFNLDSREKVLREKMALEFYGYPLDFLERYRRGIETVTAEDVTRVAKKYIKPGDVAVLVVGKAADFDGDLSSLGEVHEIDITIPPPGGSGEAIQGNAAGATLMKKMVDGLGGAAAVGRVKTLRSKGTLSVRQPQPMDLVATITKDYERMAVRQEIATPMGEMVMVATPDAGFMGGAMGNRDLPASQRQDMVKDLRSDLLYVAAHPSEYTVAAGEESEIEGTKVRALQVEGKDGVKATFWVDTASGRVLRTTAIANVGGAPTERVINLSDFREVSGLTLPFRQNVTAGGEQVASSVTESIEINPSIDEKAFSKPE